MHIESTHNVQVRETAAAAAAALSDTQLAYSLGDLVDELLGLPDWAAGSNSAVYLGIKIDAVKAELDKRHMTTAIGTWRPPA